MKNNKVMYLPKESPELISLPTFNYFMLEGKGNPNDEAFSEAIGVLYDKNQLLYTFMMRQPDFVTTDIANKALEIVQKKKPHPLLSDVTFGQMSDGMSVQMMHIGSYDDEPNSFKMMKVKNSFALYSRKR